MPAITDIDYSILPEHLRGGFQRYIENHVEPGQFIRAVLENNLMEAFGRADAICLASMFQIVGFVYNEMPGVSHGSPEKVTAWLGGQGKQ